MFALLSFLKPKPTDAASELQPRPRPPQCPYVDGEDGCPFLEIGDEEHKAEYYHPMEVVNSKGWQGACTHGQACKLLPSGVDEGHVFDYDHSSPTLQDQS